MGPASLESAAATLTPRERETSLLDVEQSEEGLRASLGMSDVREHYVGNVPTGILQEGVMLWGRRAELFRRAS